jgi:hypothetical protein
MVANGSGFTVTTPTLLSVLLQSGDVPEFILIAVRVTLYLVVDVVETMAVVNVNEPSPVPVNVLPVTIPSVYVTVQAAPLELLTVTVRFADVPEHVDTPAFIVASGSGSTVIVETEEFATAHVPLCTTAL